MGLLAVMIEFQNGVPSLVQVEREIRARFGRNIIFEGTLELTAADHEAAKLHPRSASNTPMSRARLNLCVAEPKRYDRKRYLHLSVSLSGTLIFIIGNHVELFAAAHDALITLGGVVERPKPSMAHRR